MIKKIKQFTKKVFSSKSWINGTINRFLPDSFGKLVNVEINRESRYIDLSLELNGDKSDIHVWNYEVIQEGSEGYVTFESINVVGYLRPKLKDIERNKKIKISPHYIGIAKRLLKA